MALLGKLMVIVFTALSLAVLTWAFGVYTQRIAFHPVPGKDAPGIFKTQQTQVAELSANADRAFVRWSGNYATVANLEAERYPRRSFYSVQIDLAKTGMWNNPQGGRQPAAAAVQVLVNAPNGFLDIRNPINRPQIPAREGGAPLDSIAGYDTKMAQLAKDITAAQMANEAAIKDRKLLNDEIVGVTEPKLIKGLRQLISEQKTIEEQANAEDVYAADFVTNREAEFGLLKKRRDAMTGRMAELDRDPERKFVPPPKKPADPNVPKKAGGNG